MTSSHDGLRPPPNAGADAALAGQQHPHEVEWQATLAALPGYLIVADRQRRIQLLNQPPLGRSPQDFRGADFADFVVTEHRRLVLEAVEEVLAGAPARELESRSALSGRWFRSRIIAVVERGVVTGLVVHVLDIDDAKQTESELARLRTQADAPTPASGVEAQAFDQGFVNMVDSLPMLLSYVDASGRYQYNNFAYEQWFGTPREALRGQHISAVLGPGYEQIKPHVDDALRGQSVSYETTITGPGAGTRRVSVQLIPVSNRQGQPSGFYGLVRDITQRYRMEVALRQREDELRQLQKVEALGRLSAGMAHEFNNLLQTVISGCAALSMALGGREPAAAEQVGRISRAAQRGATLTRQLLAFSRHSESDAAPLDLDALLGDMGFLLERLLGSEVMVTVDGGSGCRIVADAGEMQQVLMNLAINARDAMPEGGQLQMVSSRVEITPDATVVHTALPPGSYALLTVSDSGTGMDAQTRARIFEPFFTTKPADQGTGLGLSTVYGIVQRLHGHLEVDSAPGQGTTFRLYFPCKP